MGVFYPKPASEAAGRGGGKNVYVPMQVNSEGNISWTANRNCISEDTIYVWDISGSLNPGESYSFTPKLPICGSEFAAARA